ncbi:MAG TPA: hypothetical protein VGC15_21060 [Acetobacteraceae bacterium]
MALGSSIADALPSGIEKLRQQMAGLSSKAADAVPSAAATARPALLQQALDNAPALLELGTVLLGRLRGVRDNVAGRLAPEPKTAPPRRRFRFLRPVAISVAVFGAAYLISFMAKPGAAKHRTTRPM